MKTTDQELSDRLRAGDEEAFEHIVGLWSGMVYASCLRILRDTHAAEDATQAVFLMLLRKKASFDSKTILSSWLYRTALLTARDALRGRRRQEARERKKAEEQPTVIDHPNTEGEDRERLRHNLDKALAALPENYREVLVLHYFGGKGREEVAAELGLSVKAVSMRLSRGVEKLRSKLAAAGTAVSLSMLELVFTVERNVTPAEAFLTHLSDLPTQRQLLADLPTAGMESWRTTTTGWLKFVFAGGLAAAISGIAGGVWWQRKNTTVSDPTDSVATVTSPAENKSATERTNIYRCSFRDDATAAERMKVLAGSWEWRTGSKPNTGGMYFLGGENDTQTVVALPITSPKGWFTVALRISATNTNKSNQHKLGLYPAHIFSAEKQGLIPYVLWDNGIRRVELQKEFVMDFYFMGPYLLQVTEGAPVVLRKYDTLPDKYDLALTGVCAVVHEIRMQPIEPEDVPAKFRDVEALKKATKYDPILPKWADNRERAF
jgi:RNA polymerase sigma factor (sigma-70 family)